MFNFKRGISMLAVVGALVIGSVAPVYQLLSSDEKAQVVCVNRNDRCNQWMGVERTDVLRKCNG